MSKSNGLPPTPRLMEETGEWVDVQHRNGKMSRRQKLRPNANHPWKRHAAVQRVTSQTAPQWILRSLPWHLR